MGLRVSIKFTGFREYQAAIQKLGKPELGIPVARALVACAELALENAASEQIIRGGRFRGPPGPRGGKGKLTSSPPDPHRLTSRTGELRRSLSADRGLDRSGLSSFYVELGSDLVYAPLHELGLGRFPPRPFLAPALDAVADQFPEIFVRELVKEIPA